MYSWVKRVLSWSELPLARPSFEQCMTASVCPLLTQRVATWKVLKGSVRLLYHDFNEWELSFIDTWNFLLKSIISTLRSHLFLSSWSVGLFLHSRHDSFAPPMFPPSGVVCEASADLETPWNFERCFQASRLREWKNVDCCDIAQLK